MAEGSSNNKYLEIYNPTASTVSLDSYAFPSVSNAPTTPGTHEYWNTFTSGATIAPGDVYVICHPSADASIQAQCDQTFTYLSNGDDAFCLATGPQASPTLLDCVGDFNGDPGSGWAVCGTAAATRDNTLVRKSSVTTGNGGDWTSSAGTSTSDCEWIIYPQNTWTYVGNHTYGGASSASPPPAPSGSVPVVTIASINTNTTSGTGCYHSAMMGQLVSAYGYVTGIDAYGFYMQDGVASAPNQGIYVYCGSSQSTGYNASFIARTVGERVMVTALVDEYYSLTELNLRTTTNPIVLSISTGTTLTPLATTTGAIGSSCTASGEAHEGLLVSVTSVTITSEANQYGEVSIDDGSGPTQLEDSILNTDAHLQALLNSTTISGTYIGMVTGVVRYAYGSFEIHPRTASDIFMGTAPPPSPPAPPASPSLPPAPCGPSNCPAPSFCHGTVNNQCETITYTYRASTQCGAFLPYDTTLVTLALAEQACSANPSCSAVSVWWRWLQPLLSSVADH